LEPGRGAAIVQSEAVDQTAHGEEIVTQNGFTRAHHGGHVDWGGNGSHDQDHRDYDHHLEERETLEAVSAFGVLATHEEADWHAIHTAPSAEGHREIAYMPIKSVGTYAPPADVPRDGADIQPEAAAITSERRGMVEDPKEFRDSSFSPNRHRIPQGDKMSDFG
jgi:hypothetical protein